METSKNIFANTETQVRRRDALRTGAGAAIGVSALMLPAAIASASVGGEGGGGPTSFDFFVTDAYTTAAGELFYVQLRYTNVSGILQSVGSATASTPSAAFLVGGTQTVAWSTNESGPYTNPPYPGEAFAVPADGSIWIRCEIVDSGIRTYDGDLNVGHSGGVPTFQPQPLTWFND